MPSQNSKTKLLVSLKMTKLAHFFLHFRISYVADCQPWPLNTSLKRKHVTGNDEEEKRSKQTKGI